MPYNTTYIWNLKNNASELIYKAATDTENRPVGFPRGGMDQEFGNSRCKSNRMDIQQGPTA